MYLEKKVLRIRSHKLIEMCQKSHIKRHPKKNDKPPENVSKSMKSEKNALIN